MFLNMTRKSETILLKGIVFLFFFIFPFSALAVTENTIKIPAARSMVDRQGKVNNIIEQLRKRSRSSSRVYYQEIQLAYRGLSIEPNNLILLRHLAQIYIKIDYYEKAKEILEKIIAIDPTSKTDKELLIFTEKAIHKLKIKERKFMDDLRKNPDDVSLRLKIIHIKINLGDYKGAIKLTENGLRRNPDDVSLLYAGSEIYMDLQKFDMAERYLRRILQLHPENRTYRKMLDLAITLKKEQPKSISVREKHAVIQKRRNFSSLKLDRKIEAINQSQSEKSNFIIINNETDSVKQTRPGSTQKDTWTYSLLTYYHRFHSGTLGGEVNQASRFGQNGFQYQIFYYPKLIGRSYAYFSYANSNSTLFPSNYYIGELYLPIGSHLTVSSGYSYSKILQTSLELYTNSLTLDIHNYSFSIRPNYYVPKIGPRSLYWIFIAKRHFTDPDNYIALQFETGQTPDLADLSSIGFFMIHANVVRLSYQFHLIRGIFMQLGIGFSKETYLVNQARTKFFGGLGLKFKF